MIYARIMLAAAIVLVLLTAGWAAHAYYDASVALKIEQVRQQAALGAADAIARIEVKNTTTYAKTVERIKTDVQYRGCVQDPVTLQLTNSILTGE